ncbi:MAG: MGMT family protein [Gemmatimonadota bacterium]|jgi:methylated-DNA-protein-cysteine methyltransferase-like protein|nr:MGMT family protein [Gemmatimonadota bacterium]
MTEFAERVRRAVDRIPYGRVATYADVAELAGARGAARGVGSVLRQLPEGSRLPWWRVLGAGGKVTLPDPGGQLQRLLLLQEGIPFRSSRTVDLRRCHWEKFRDRK